MDGTPNLLGPAEPARDGDAIGVIPVPAKQTLQDWALEVRYFTTALLHTHGRLDRDPLFEYNARQPDENLRPFAIDCHAPFFAGLGSCQLDRAPRPTELVNWDHRIYGISPAGWEQLFPFLAGICIIDPKTYHYARVFSHPLEIVDATAFSRGMALDRLPTIMVTVFGVDTNRHLVSMQPASDPPRTRARPYVDKPRTVTIVDAVSTLGPPLDPEAPFR